MVADLNGCPPLTAAFLDPIGDIALGGSFDYFPADIDFACLWVTNQVKGIWR